jgi:uncharacterized membrane protein YedE/YeeE
MIDRVTNMFNIVANGGHGSVWTVLFIGFLFGAIIMYSRLDKFEILLGGLITGAIIFGIGLVILGKCPSAFFVSVSEGRVDAFVGVLGGMLGGAVFTLLYPWIKEFMGPNLGNLQVTQFFTEHSLLVVLIYGY